MPVPKIEELLRLQRAYYEVLSTWEPRPWGALGLNRENPTSHDSNHGCARIDLTPESLPAVLDEVADWYRPHAHLGIMPRLHVHIPPADERLISVGRERGWAVDEMAETWRVWPAAAGHQDPAPVAGMSLSVVGSESFPELFAVYGDGASDDAAPRRRAVWSALVGSDHTDCLLARIDGEPAAGLACVWNGDWGSIENVETRQRFRRRGICSSLIRHLQRMATERGATGLLLYDTEEGPDRIYARAGFQFVAQIRSVQMCLTPAA